VNDGSADTARSARNVRRSIAIHLHRRIAFRFSGIDCGIRSCIDDDIRSHGAHRIVHRVVIGDIQICALE